MNFAVSTYNHRLQVTVTVEVLHHQFEAIGDACGIFAIVDSVGRDSRPDRNSGLHFCVDLIVGMELEEHCAKQERQHDACCNRHDQLAPQCHFRLNT